MAKQTCEYCNKAPATTGYAGSKVCQPCKDTAAKWDDGPTDRK